MRVFELHFNPKLKHTIWDSFIYEPENIYEKKLGNLYMVGYLCNVLPQNSGLLNNVASIIKEEYYTGLQRSPESSFRESLNKANEFLAQEAKKGNVGWLGNLNFAILSFKDFVLNFTKNGELKILLAREQDLLDIGQNLEFQNAKSYPLKVFGTIATGKLAPLDSLMIANREVVNYFEKANILKEILSVKKEQELKKIFKRKEDFLKKLSGICLIMNLTPEDTSQLDTEQKELSQSLVFDQNKIKFPKIFPLKIFLKSALSEQWVLKPLKKIPTYLAKCLSKCQSGFHLKSKFSTLKKVCVQTVGKSPTVRTQLKNFLKKLKDLGSSCRYIGRSCISGKISLSSIKNFKKNLITILILFAVLLLGFYTFKAEREEELKQAQQVLEQVESKMILADSFLIFKNQARANLLFRKAWEKILPHTKSEAPLRERALALKKSIQEKLIVLNKLENIKNPQISPDQKIFAEKKSPRSKLSFNAFSNFSSYTYLLNSSIGEILKCSLPLKIDNCRSWIKTKKAIGAKSMAIDGNIWILNRENGIDRYYRGRYQETLKLNLWPALESPNKIWTSLSHPYLYLLEPAQNRLIILTKIGEIVKQYRSEKFDHLLDFAVSENGKTIWVLNDSNVYKIKFKLPANMQESE